jgi:hypothetical protein
MMVFVFNLSNAQTPTEMRRQTEKAFNKAAAGAGLFNTTFKISQKTILHKTTIEDLHRFYPKHSLTLWKQEITSKGGANRFAQNYVGSYRRSYKISKNFEAMGVTHYQVTITVSGRNYKSNLIKI